MKLISNHDKTSFIPLSEVSKFDIFETADHLWKIKATTNGLSSFVVKEFLSKKDAIRYLMKVVEEDK